MASSPSRTRALVFIFGAASTLGGISACTSILGDFTVGSTPTTPENEGGLDVAEKDVVNDRSDENTPDATPAGLFTGARQVTGGARHTCALDGNGDVYCWGDNSEGQLGQPPALGRATKPKKVPLPAPAAVVVAGGFHTCAVAKNFDMYCWGRNACGQTGAGDTQNPAPPRQVKGGLQWALVAPGVDHTCSVDQGGALYCWGCNQQAQAGTIGTTPVLFPGGSNAAQTDKQGLVASITANAAHTCGASTSASGTVCWGSEDDGELGNGAPATGDTTATAAAVALTTVTKLVSAGVTHTCALDANGDVSCWGKNDSGQLAISGMSQPAPSAKVAGGPFVTMAARGDFTCFIGAQGGLVTCAGSNTAAQLGRSPDTASHPNRQAIYEPGTPGKPLAAVAIGLGREHGCAITPNDGRIVCWGNGADGQLGDGTSGGAPRDLPVRVLAAE